MAYKAIDIAKKIILWAMREDDGELVSNLKLQKLLYYMQGFHLAVFNTPLFEEEIEAWMYGPVVPCVYNEYARFGRGGIEIPEEEPIQLSKKEEDLFYDVMKIYGEYSAIGLMNLTHKAGPWKHMIPGPGHVISHRKLRNFFVTQVEEGYGEN